MFMFLVLVLDFVYWNQVVSSQVNLLSRLQVVDYGQCQKVVLVAHICDMFMAFLGILITQ